MNKRKAKLLLLCLKTCLIFLVYSCEAPVVPSEKETLEIITKDSSDTYLSKSKIDQWISAEEDDEKIKLVQEFLEHRNTLLEQEMDSSTSSIIPIIEVEMFYHSADYLAVAIGNLRDWKVSFLVLTFNGKHYEVMHHKMVNAHYRSPKIERLKDNFLSLEYEVGGATDLLEQEIIVYYLDTDEEKIEKVLTIPHTRHSGSYLKYEITPYVEYKGAHLKVQMDYKLWFCDYIIGDSTYTFEKAKEISDEYGFYQCISEDEIVLLDDSKQFRFEWTPEKKQFSLKKGDKRVWKLFEQFTSTNISFCEMYQTFEEDIKEYNPENALAVERLIKICELEDE